MWDVTFTAHHYELVAHGVAGEGGPCARCREQGRSCPRWRTRKIEGPGFVVIDATGVEIRADVTSLNDHPVPRWIEDRGVAFLRRRKDEQGVPVWAARKLQRLCVAKLESVPLAVAVPAEEDHPIPPQVVGPGLSISSERRNPARAQL